MTSSPLSRLLLLFVFCAHVFAGLGNAQGFAWCFSAEGNARLEKNFQGDCETADPCAEESRKAAHADHGKGDPGHCGDCLDFPSLVQDVHQASRFSTDADLPAPALVSPSDVRFSLSFPLLDEVAGLRPQPPPPQPALALLRTVVLII